MGPTRPGAAWGASGYLPEVRAPASYRAGRQSARESRTGLLLGLSGSQHIARCEPGTGPPRSARFTSAVCPRRLPLSGPGLVQVWRCSGRACTSGSSGASVVGDMQFDVGTVGGYLGRLEVDREAVRSVLIDRAGPACGDLDFIFVDGCVDDHVDG